MPDRNKKLLINNWLLKSDEALENAKEIIKQDMLPVVQNRLYYAIFYAVMGLAKLNNFTTSKHGQLIGWFNREFIKTNKIDIKYGKLYRKVFDNRQKSDYTFTFKPDKEVLLNDIEEVKEFTKIIKQLINE